jgi:dTDP-4-amino-4,6-dideoxygalactose transaminase
MFMKKIVVSKPALPSLFSYLGMITPLWKSRHITNGGVVHNLLEEKLRAFLNVNSLSLFTNGHVALETAIEVLDLKGEVITTPFTFASTTQAILNKGLKPIFCDIKREDFTIDVDKIRSLITERTSAIIPVHVFGSICEVDKIQEIANEFNLKVIYDAAHAFGTLLDGKPISIYGDIVMYSFHATKVFHTVEGGALAYQSNELKSKITSLRNFGITPSGDILPYGTNGKMSEFHASIGLLNLQNLTSEISKRRRIASIYDRHLSKLVGIETLKNNPRVDSNFSYYAILVDSDNKSRDELYDFMHSKGIIVKKYFYPLTSEISDQLPLLYQSQHHLPVATNIVKRTLLLPIYGSLKRKELMYVIKCIKEYMQS